VNLIEYGLKAIGASLANETAAQDIGDVYISPSAKDQGIYKAYMPRYLYRPPFGYPRTDNVMLQRQLAKNAFIFAVHKSIKDEVGNAKWEIRFRKDAPKKDDPQIEELRKRITAFFRNPNRNKESWAQMRKKYIKDILEVDSGVLIKVFNYKGEFCQLFCYDGGSFLVNPDIHGYMGARDDFVAPMDSSWAVGQRTPLPDQIKQYALAYSENAAYFQYGTVSTASIPIPFGKREVIYQMQNPQTTEPYGVSPMSILTDIILNLVYGANFSLDFFMNNNMPEGVLEVLGASEDEMKALKRSILHTAKVKDEMTGFTRRVGYRMGITPKPIKFVPFQLDPKTMQIIENQKWFYPLVLACHGVPPNAVGLDQGQGLRTGDGDNQLKYYLRKSAKPIMDDLKYKIDNEIIAEFGPEAYENLEYCWDDYDLDEDIKRHTLYEKQIQIGIKTPKMIAEEEGIDYSEVEEFQKQKQEEQMQMQQDAQGQPAPETETPDNAVDSFLAKYEVKSKSESELEESMVRGLKDSQKELVKALSELQ
jgi:hypothetical protein